MNKFSHLCSWFYQIFFPLQTFKTTFEKNYFLILKKWVSSKYQRSNSLWKEWVALTIWFHTIHANIHTYACMCIFHTKFLTLMTLTRTIVKPKFIDLSYLLSLSVLVLGTNGTSEAIFSYACLMSSTTWFTVWEQLYKDRIGPGYDRLWLFFKKFKMTQFRA